MYCSNCGNKLSEDFDFCPECGTKVISSNSFDGNSASSYLGSKKEVCPKCGEAMPEDVFYCLNCGNAFYDASEDFEDIKKKIDVQTGTWRNKWVALLLCVFLGWLGIHRFYEGKVLTGVLYFFTVGICGVGWIADIIRIILKPNPYRVK